MHKKGNKNLRKLMVRRNNYNKILLTGLISVMVLIATTPLVFGVHEDTLVISFDPQSDIDIDVSHATWNFSTVTVNEWTNTTGEQFTLYNNGTIAMDTEIRADNVTVEGNMTLNLSGVAPGEDEYAIYIDDLDVEQYLNESYVAEFDLALASMASKSFDVCLLMGTNTSLNHSWQTTTIHFRGSIF